MIDIVSVGFPPLLAQRAQVGETTGQRRTGWATREVRIMKPRLYEMTLETLIQRRDSLPYRDKGIADIDREIALRVRSVFNPMATNGTLAQAIEHRAALKQILGPWR
jgi:hypothetical protein